MTFHAAWIICLLHNAISIRTKKWYMKCFYYLLGMTLVNSWIIYKKVHGNKLTLAKFKEEVAVSLSQQYKKPTRGRRYFLENQITIRRKRKPYQKLKFGYMDCITAHWPHWSTERRQCKKPGFTDKTFRKCEKCEVYLCYGKDKMCFIKMFHRT